MDNLLEVIDLRISFEREGALLPAVDGIGFSLRRGETVCLVGESGCGKSVTALSILGLLPPEARVSGDVLWMGEPSRPDRLRGREIAMVFQEPSAALDPVMTVGDQIAESLRFVGGMGRREAGARAVELLAQTGVGDSARIARAYPHQLSGGVCQRVMISIALACNPSLLLADEPTTALDVTVQAQILSLLRRAVEDRGLALFLVTHDMGVVARMADRVLVMYSGQIVEEGEARALLCAPKHPYTRALLACVPRMEGEEELAPIPGVPPVHAGQGGCPFAPRCPKAEARCVRERPVLRPSGEGGRAACHLLEGVDNPM